MYSKVCGKKNPLIDSKLQLLILNKHDHLFHTKYLDITFLFQKHH